MIPDSLAPGIVIRAPDKTSARESGDEANGNIFVDLKLLPMLIFPPVHNSSLLLSMLSMQMLLDVLSVLPL